MSSGLASVDKARGLLKRLFRTENADLDFGIYRIMNFKRAEIERFIDKDLIEAAEAEFKEFARAGAAELEKELDKRKRDINDFVLGTIGEDWVVLKNHDLPKVKEFMEVLEEYRVASVSEEQVQDVFNHVYEFFSRYYEDGDFIPRTRYGGRDKYFMPYNGEEVLLHWATKDMYYVKTGEYFNKYSFRVGRFRVTFKLVEAQIEQGNVKGDKKFFLLHDENPVQFNEASDEVEIRFNYRALTDEEKEKYRRRTRTKIQKDLVDEALTRIGASLGVSSISGIVRPRSGEEKSLMRKHLEAYVERNTKDFFIHKDLKSFLSKELEFYLKNEVWDLNVLENTSESQTKLMMAKAKAIRGISTKIIEFLAQIEEFQKRLFEKKKFILRTDYCITLDLIPEEFYKEIGKNKLQVAEWKELYKLDETTKSTLQSTVGKKTLGVEFLHSHRFLVLDTKFFGQDFKDRLLERFENLDEIVGGLAIKSENWQALHLLSEKYREKIKCVYIDPPYNTKSNEFLYKDGFKNSSWLCMIENRLKESHDLLKKDGIIISHIDENECEKLTELLKQEFGDNNYLGTVIWDKRNPKGDAKQIAYQHESILYSSKDKRNIENVNFMRRKQNVDKILSKAKQLFTKIGKKTLPQSIEKFIKSLDYSEDILNRLKIEYNLEKVQKEFQTWLSMQDFSGGEKAYKLIDENGRAYRGVSMAWPGSKAPKEYFYDILHPTTKKPCPIPAKGWRFKKETMDELLQTSQIIFGKDETTQPQRKYYLDEYKDENFPSVIYYGGDASIDLSPLGLEFPTAKPLFICDQILQAILSKDDLIIDYFAGSGSAAHSIMRLNEQDRGSRKFILVEIADFFDMIMMPRIKKVMFSKEWNGGNPLSKDGVSLIFKYLYPEQYEDTLNNIEFIQKDSSIQIRLDRLPDYFLTYMLDYETKDSPTRLALEQFKTPFNYRIKTISGGEEKEEPVDLVETFNYLLGLHINRFRGFKDGDRLYKVVYGTRGNEQVVVIWRNTLDLDLKRDKEFIENTVLSDITPDTIYINGDSYIENANPIEPEFKRLMGA